MKEKISIKILVVCLTVSISCNIIGAYILAERLAFNQKQEDMERINEDYWDGWAKQQSYDRAFSEWDDFECTFDNETLVLETECGGHGDMTITIFSSPVVNISLGYWDKYQTTEKWEERNGEIWIKDTDENVLVIPKDWIICEEPANFYRLMNISVPSWKFYEPANTWTHSQIIIQNNISSNLTIVVRKDIEPFNDYNGRTYRFVPVIYTFEVRT